MRTLKLPVLAHTWRLTHEPMHPQCPLRLTELKQTIREQHLDVKFHNCKSCPTMAHRARSCLHIGVNDRDFHQHCCPFSIQRVANDLVYTHGHCGDISGCCGVLMVSADVRSTLSICPLPSEAVLFGVRAHPEERHKFSD